MERTCEKLVNFIYALHLRKLCQAFRFFVVPKTEAFQHSLLKTKQKGKTFTKYNIHKKMIGNGEIISTIYTIRAMDGPIQLVGR